MLESYLNWVLGFIFLVALVVVLESLKEFVEVIGFSYYIKLKVKRKL